MVIIAILEAFCICIIKAQKDISILIIAQATAHLKNGYILNQKRG